MDSSPSQKASEGHRFSSRRAQRNYLYLGIVVAVVLGAQGIWFIARYRAGDNLFVPLVGDAFGILAGAGLSLRSFSSSTIDITGDRLTYRSLVQTKVFSRNQIAKVCIVQRYRGLRQMSLPYLELKDGHEVRLTDFSIPIATVSDRGQLLAQPSPRRIDELNAQTELMATLRRWVNTNLPSE